jgi:hypothetical protein
MALERHQRLTIARIPDGNNDFQQPPLINNLRDNRRNDAVCLSDDYANYVGFSRHRDNSGTASPPIDPAASAAPPGPDGPPRRTEAAATSTNA